MGIFLGITYKFPLLIKNPLFNFFSYSYKAGNQIYFVMGGGREHFY